MDEVAIHHFEVGILQGWAYRRNRSVGDAVLGPCVGPCLGLVSHCARKVANPSEAEGCVGVAEDAEDAAGAVGVVGAVDAVDGEGRLHWGSEGKLMACGSGYVGGLDFEAGSEAASFEVRRIHDAMGLSPCYHHHRHHRLPFH